MLYWLVIVYHSIVILQWFVLTGAFRVEMQRESQKDRTILCKFDPTEPGDYRVEVKWAGEHVPGSPFMVMIFDTQQELNRYLQVIVGFVYLFEIVYVFLFGKGLYCRFLKRNFILG